MVVKPFAFRINLWKWMEANSLAMVGADGLLSEELTGNSQLRSIRCRSICDRLCSDRWVSFRRDRSPS